LSQGGQRFWLPQSRPGGPSYIAGGDFSLAAIPLGAQMYRCFNLEIARPEAPNVLA